MPNTTPSHPLKLVSLSLAFLLTGLLGCSHGSQGEQAAAAKAAAAPAAAPAGASQAPAAGGNAPQAPATAAGAQPATAGAAPPPPPLPQAQIPAVVAKVNGTPIAKSDLVRLADQLHAQIPTMPETADFYRKVLDQLVSNRLLVDEAKAAGITAADDEVNKQLGDLKSRMTPEKYQEELKKEGLTEADLLKQTRETIEVQKFVDAKVVNDVTVSDQQVKAFYDQNPDKLKRPERLHVRHILINAKDASPADKQKARAKADDLLAKLKAGGDFAKLAEESSDDPGSKQHGGELPWFSKGQMVPPFEAAAFALKQPNDLSPVVETQFGFHIIQLIEHQDAGLVPFDEVKARIAGFLKQQQQREKFLDHVKALKAKSKIETFI